MGNTDPDTWGKAASCRRGQQKLRAVTAVPRSYAELVWRSLPFTYMEEFDKVVAAQEDSSSEAASPPTTGRFQQIQTMSDYRALFSCVHLFQEEDHWKGLLGMLLVSSAPLLAETRAPYTQCPSLVQEATFAKRLPSIRPRGAIGTTFTTRR